MKPKKYKHFQKGNKFSNTLLTRIRTGRSYLNQHKFSIGHAESPECLCLHREESPLHYFIECFLYSPERQALFSLFEHYIPSFPNFSKQRKLEILLKGINIENDDFYHTNISLTIAVPNFILETKRCCNLFDISNFVHIFKSFHIYLFVVAMKAGRQVEYLLNIWKHYIHLQMAWHGGLVWLAVVSLYWVFNLSYLVHYFNILY